MTRGEKTVEGPILSICIATFNRREPLCRLLDGVLATDLPVEVCVHVDGSTDGSLEAVQALAASDGRLKVGSAANQGRARALAAAVAMARAPFIMIYDDDDDLYPEPLAALCRQLREPLPDGVCGYIFLMADGDDGVLGTRFPSRRSNLLKLRADEGVIGDKKEVVRADILQSRFRTSSFARRVPTSATWAAIALDYDILCENVVLGAKWRLADGLTLNITRNKLRNPVPMVITHALRMRGFLQGRYRSWRFFLSSLRSVVVYSLVSLARLPVDGPKMLRGKAA
ncbi:MAG: glycosyltransferase family 2 protein [Ignavibacteriales bacterium]